MRTSIKAAKKRIAYAISKQNKKERAESSKAIRDQVKARVEDQKHVVIQDTTPPLKKKRISEIKAEYQRLGK